MSVIKIDNLLNKPTITVDGEIMPPVLYGLSDLPVSASFAAQAQRNIAAFSRAGVKLVNVDIGIHHGWFKHDPFDAEPVLAEIANALEGAEDVKILVRLHLNAPYWWHRDHPEECVIYRTPDGDIFGIDNGEQDRIISHDYERSMRVSLASELWLREAGERLALVCEALECSPEREALLGIQVACGVYGEWHQWGTDVSAPMVKKFRNMLREKYTTDSALCQAWHRDDVTLDGAEFHPEFFAPADDGDFRDPRFSQQIVDSQECLQSAAPDAIIHFCSIIKEKLPDIIVGAFYGYYWGIDQNCVAQEGHLMVDKLYARRDIIDFLCGPFCYMDNRRANGVPLQRGMLESNRLNGFLWLTEMDQHAEGSDPMGRGDPEQLEQTIAILRRNVLQPLCAGQGLWYYDHRVIPQFRPGAKAGGIYRKRGWWEEQELMNEISKLQKLAAQIVARPYIPAADVLLVSDTKSFFYRARVEDNVYKLHEAIARCGVSYDCIYFEDLEKADISRYKCVVITNAFMISPEMREKCRRVLSGTYTVWLYASGYCDGECLDTDNISRTVGMEIKKVKTARCIDYAPLVPNEAVDIEQSYTPIFAVNDKEAVALALYDSGGVAAAIHNKDIWIGLPIITPSIMSAVFKKCGVHIYSTDQAPIIAGGGIVAINCPYGGKRTVTLKNGKRISLDISGPATVVLDAENGEVLL